MHWMRHVTFCDRRVGSILGLPVASLQGVLIVEVC